MAVIARNAPELENYPQLPKAPREYNFEDQEILRAKIEEYIGRLTGSKSVRSITGLADVATSGDAADLTGLANVAYSGAAADVSGLAAVATSGSATDLSTGTLGAARTPAFTGDVTKPSGSGVQTIPNDTVTYAKMQNISATARLLGRKTAGAGDPEELTLSETLDLVGSAARGDLLFRGATLWQRIAAGTSGFFLRTAGAGADPSWAAVPTPGLILLNSGSVSAAAALDIVLTGYTAYRGIRIVLSNFIPATDDVLLYVRFSTNGGVSFDAGASDYAHGNVRTVNATTGGGGVAADTKINLTLTGEAATNNISNVAAEGGITSIIDILSQTATGVRTALLHKSSYWNAANTGLFQITGSGRRNLAQDTDAVRFIFSAGNIAQGQWAIYGYN